MNPECACEQSTYWATYFSANCPEVIVVYCCSKAEIPYGALAESREYHPDYLGSVEAVTNAKGEVYQFFHNTIWGEPLQQQKAFLYNSFSSRYRFNGKERDWETGNYYYGARYYDPKISVWLSVDPLAHNFPGFHSYQFTYNNPLKFVDIDGRAAGDFIDENGIKIGDDGIDDGKVYLIKTTETEFDGGAKSGGITDAEKASAISFVKNNSGDCWAFETEEGQKAKDSFIDVSISKDTRNSMYEVVKKDNGDGGTNDANNREYGGYVRPNGEVLEKGPGPINDLKQSKGQNLATLEYVVNNKADVAYRFHSHPSGYYWPKNSYVYNYNQPPSPQDIVAAQHLNIVFGRKGGRRKSKGTVYFYNSTGVVATMSTRAFLKY